MLKKGASNIGYHLTRAVKRIRSPLLLSCSTLAIAACSGSPGTAELTQEQFRVSAPTQLIQSRMINQANLFAEVVLSYEGFVNDVIATREGVSGTWVGSLPIPLNTPFNLTVTWFDTASGNRLDLTTTSQDFEPFTSVGSSFITVNFDNLNGTAFDDDTDSISNLQERIDGTDPLSADDQSDQISQPINENQSDVFSAAEAEGEIGSYFAQNPPDPIGSLALLPLSLDEANAVVIPGGSIIVPVESEDEFSTIFVSGEQDGVGAIEHFEVQLPAAVTEADLILTFRPQISEDAIQQINVQVGAVDGSISPVSSASFGTVSAGTGEVQVSVSWDKESDVDLHLVEPGGEVIFFGNLMSELGGELDLDSNAGCRIDGVKNENITYPDSLPPIGTYEVRVVYFSACDQGDTNFVVTVNNQGDVTTTTGTLTDARESQTVLFFDVQ